MAVIIKRKSANEIALDEVGLGEAESYHANIVPFDIGARVQLIAKSGPWKYICKTGNVGVVVKLARSHSAVGVFAKDDLYFVKMDHLLGSEKEIVYCTYEELALVG